MNITSITAQLNPLCNLVAKQSKIITSFAFNAIKCSVEWLKSNSPAIMEKSLEVAQKISATTAPYFAAAAKLMTPYQSYIIVAAAGILIGSILTNIFSSKTRTEAAANPA